MILKNSNYILLVIIVFILNSIMALSLDLIIIKNYKTMTPLDFEPGSAFIMYVLLDPVWPYVNFQCFDKYAWLLIYIWI